MLDMLREFALAGRPLGALLAPGTRSWCANSTEWNSQQVAYALWWFGYRLARPAWVALAEKLTAWSLTAPQNSGIFATMYELEDGWHVPAHPATSQELANCTWTGRWLLGWHGDLSHGEAVLPFVESFGAALIKHSAMIGPPTIGEVLDTPVIEATALGALFLAELVQATGDGRITTALVQSYQHLATALAPEQTGGNDPRLLAYYGLALLKGYRVTGDHAHLQAGVALTERCERLITSPDMANGSTPLLAELYAATYRLTEEPRYARRAVMVLEYSLPGLQIPADLDWPQVQALATLAVLEANYADVLVVGRTPALGDL